MKRLCRCVSAEEKFLPDIKKGFDEISAGS